MLRRQEGGGETAERERLAMLFAMNHFLSTKSLQFDEFFQFLNDPRRAR